MGKGKRSAPAPLVGGAATEQDIAAYQAELMGAPIAQSRAIPSAIGLEEQLLPLLQSYYFKSVGSTAEGVSDLYSGLEDGAIKNQGRYGNSLIGLYGDMGTKATEAARNSLTGNARGIYDTMTRTANEDLALGSQLNSQETDFARGAARAAATARGLNFSRQGSDLEILNTYNMGQKRLNERREFAGKAYQMGRDLQTYGAQTYLAPALEGSSIYSVPGLIAGAEGAIGNFGPRVLQPESQYLANVRGNRIQGVLGQEQAAATRNAGITSGLATLAAAFITKGCWVAREAYGKDNPKWLVFREWLFSSAPEWLYDLYMVHGEQFAEFISDKPALKWMVRKTMDFLIMREEKKLTYQIYGC